MLGMTPTLSRRSTLAAVFAAGLALGALYSPMRYTIIPSGDGFVYRLDRFTGRISVGQPAGQLRDLEEPGNWLSWLP